MASSDSHPALPPTNEHPPFNITRASHVVLQVRDLARCRAFYVDTLGFVVSDETPERLYLRGLEEACHHSLVLEKAAAPACRFAGFRVRLDDELDAVKAHFEAHGLPASWAETPFQRRTLHVADPSGARLDICANMETRPRQILAASVFVGACPLRLDHFQILTPFVAEAHAFYAGMGFRLSEYIAPDGVDAPDAVFLQRKGNPHDVVFFRSDGPRLHHVAYVVPETYHLMHLCDRLAEAGFGSAVEFGPQRHFSPGFARFVYLRDPDGHRLEFFTTHYQTLDSEEEPLRWNVSDLGGGWGPRPPQSWRTEASAFPGVPVQSAQSAAREIFAR
ncbi:MAG TPA: VOC family protein [Rhodoblastus sp.]|nr:VOC family protein [Rhodoblastus sp.]